MVENVGLRIGNVVRGVEQHDVKILMKATATGEERSAGLLIDEQVLRELQERENRVCHVR